MTENQQEPEKPITKWGLAVVEKSEEGEESVFFIGSNLDSKKPLIYDNPKVAEKFLRSSSFPGVFGDRQNVKVRSLPDNPDEVSLIQRKGIGAQGQNELSLKTTN